MIRCQKRTSKKSRKGYTWRVFYTWTDSYGIQREETKSGFATKKEAQEYAVRMQAELEKNSSFLMKQKHTLQDIWDEYCAVKIHTIKFSTWRGYVSAYEIHIKPVLGKALMRDLNYARVQIFFNSLEGTGKARVKTIRTVMGNLFSYALSMQYVSFNPMHDIRLKFTEKKRKEDKDPEYITFEQLNEVIDVYMLTKQRVPMFKKRSCMIALYIGYYMGLRLSEMLALHWSDIDLEAGTAFIGHQLEILEGYEKVITDSLKTRASKATMPVPMPLRKILEDWRKENPHELVVCDEFGRNLTQPTISSGMAFLSEKLGWRFHFHSLRHTYITNVVRVCDPRTAARLARHANVDVTLNIYTEIDTCHHQEIVARAFGYELPAPE